MGGRAYTMENKDTNTDYQKVIGLGDDKWNIVEITIGIICLFVWDLYHYFLYRKFSSPTWKKSPLAKEPIPTRSRFPIWPNLNLLKNGSASPSSPRRVANYEDVQDANA